jgi:hypothetical protein
MRIQDSVVLKGTAGPAAGAGGPMLAEKTVFSSGFLVFMDQIQDPPPALDK